MVQNFIYGKKFCAIEHISLNGEEHIHGLRLHKKQQELVINNSFEVKSIDKLETHIPNKQHLFLIINTNKVVFKVIEEDMEPLQAMQRAFPNLNQNDFYYEILTTSHRTFVAICRKEHVQAVLNSYHQKQFYVIGFSLGNLSVSAVEQYIDTNKINTSNAVIQFDNNKISQIKLNHQEKQRLHINGLEVTNTTVLSVAGILTYYSDQSKTASNFRELIQELRLKFKQQHIFNHGLKISLATIFVLLLFSFLLFTNYTTKIQDLTTTLTLNKTQKTSLLKLKSDVQKKEKLIQDFSMASSKASWYLDQVGQVVPKSVILTEIQWQPVSKSIKNETLIETKLHILLIKGVTNNGDDFSTWLSLLEKSNWVEKMLINGYGSGKKASTSFELEITFKP